MKKTLYDIFEVSPDANPEAIRNAYKSLVQRHHPDKNQGDPHAEEVLKAINFAYGVLSDPMKRLAYDASLAAMQGGQNPVAPPSDDTLPKAAGNRADARRRGSNPNGEGVSASETAEPEVERAVHVPAQSKNRLAVMLLLAFLIGGVLVLLLPGGGGQNDVTSLAVTKPEPKLDVASGDQAAPRSLTEISPAPGRQTPEVSHSDGEGHVSREQNAGTPPAKQSILVKEPPVKAEIAVPAPTAKQNNVAAQGAKTQPMPQPPINARESIETPGAKPKDTAHPSEQLAGPQAKVNEGGKKPVSDQGKAVAIDTQGGANQQSIPPEQFALQAEELPDKTAAQRDPMAQYKKGIMYEKGQGMPQDFSQAAHWYRQAAEQGIADAQYRLGKFYTVGKGVSIDNIEAYAWLSLAATGNVDAAKPIADYLASTMTPEQLANAKRRAAALRARHKR
jgi:curved DNA-binding protein CbpA